MSTEVVDLFEVPDQPLNLPRVTFHDGPCWSRIVTIKKPGCGHCQMLNKTAEMVGVHPASWTRIGKDGSVLELCEQHRVHQRERDAELKTNDLDGPAYRHLRAAIIATMPDPDVWDDDKPEEAILADYVRLLSLAYRRLTALAKETQGDDAPQVTSAQLHAALAGL